MYLLRSGTNSNNVFFFLSLSIFSDLRHLFFVSGFRADAKQNKNSKKQIWRKSRKSDDADPRR